MEIYQLPEWVTTILFISWPIFSMLAYKQLFIMFKEAKFLCFILALLPGLNYVFGFLQIDEIITNNIIKNKQNEKKKNKSN